MPCFEQLQADGVDGIILDVPMTGIGLGKGSRNQGSSLHLGGQYLILQGDPVEQGITLEVGNSHLRNRWILTCNDHLMEVKTPKVSGGSRDLRVGDLLQCLHI